MIFSIIYNRAFLIQVPAAVLAIILVSTFLKVPPKEAGDLKAKLRRIDFSGAFTLIVAVFSLLLALDRGGNVSWTNLYTLAPLAISVVFFILFGVVETHPAVAKEPFAPKRILSNTSLLSAYLANFFGLACAMSLVFHLALYFQAVANKSAAQAGLGLLPAIVGGVFGSLVGGIIMQKTGKYYWLTVGAYGMQFIGTGIVLMLTGVVVQSPLGASLCKPSHTTFFLVDDRFTSALAIMSVGNG